MRKRTAKAPRLVLRGKFLDDMISGPQLRTDVAETFVGLGNSSVVTVRGEAHGRTDQPPIFIVKV